MAETKQQEAIAILEERGYVRVPRSRAPARMRRGRVEQRVDLQGKVETWVRQGGDNGPWKRIPLFRKN